MTGQVPGAGWALRAWSVNIRLKCVPLQPGGAGASRHHAAHVEGPCPNVQTQAGPRKRPEVGSGEGGTQELRTLPPKCMWMNSFNEKPASREDGGGGEGGVPPSPRDRSHQRHPRPGLPRQGVPGAGGPG